MPPKTTDRERIGALVAGINRLSGGLKDQSEFYGGLQLASNRGNKLKRKAEWAHEGRLGGQGPYKKRINHAGFERDIVHRNPLRYDDEGIPLDSDEEDAEADADVAERNPYHGVEVQNILAPLTAASDLWQHPGLSHALTSEALSEMVVKSRETLRKERRTLSLMKGLATRLRGDHIHTPSSMLLTDGDIDFYSAEDILRGLPEIAPPDMVQTRTPEPAIAVNVVAAEDAITNGAKEEGTQAEDVNMAEGDAEPPATTNGIAEALSSTTEAGATETVRDTASRSDGAIDHQANGTPEPGAQLDNEGSAEQPARRMVTRGAAAAANGTSHEQDPHKQRSSSPTSSQPGIHPTFIPPHSSAPDRDLGLPPWEAEETRKLANVFVQKQEEVVRGAERLYEMFLRAEKLRKKVYWWSRAEAHVGEMSDGEEWVDQDEWGLDAPLRKGAAEGEEEGREEERKGKGRRTRAVVG